MATKTYPIPGTNADKILKLIAEQPGISVTSIINQLELNPSPGRECIKALLEYEAIEDRPEPNGYHHYYVKEVSTDG